MRNVRLDKLIEREKELNCIYAIEEILRKNQSDMEGIFRQVIGAIPSGWQFSTVCEARIIYKDMEVQTPDFRETEWMQSADIVVDENVEGTIHVCYTQLIRMQGASQFLPQEQKLLNTIADRISDYIFYKKLESTVTFLGKKKGEPEKTDEETLLKDASDEHWKWRLKMCEAIAYKMDFDRFGVKGLYICGSTKNAEAGPGSDIDLIVHQQGTDLQQQELIAWLQGWGLCLSEVNYSRTGYRVDESLIDLHIVNDEDMKKKTSFAAMIGSCYNSARPLKVKEQ